MYVCQYVAVAVVVAVVCSTIAFIVMVNVRISSCDDNKDVMTMVMFGET